MFDKDYNKGYRGEMYTGGSYLKWLRGDSDRKRDERNNSGGSDGCTVFIVLAIILFPLVIGASLAAFPATLLFIWIRYDFKKRTYSFRQIFVSIWWCIIIYASCSSILAFSGFYGSMWLTSEIISDEWWIPTTVIALILSQVIAIGLASLYLHRSHRHALKALRYWNAVIYVVCIIIPSICVISAGMYILLLNFNISNL